MKNLFRKTSKGTTPKALKIKCTKETKEQVSSIMKKYGWTWNEFESFIEKEGLEFLGWREVPTYPQILGKKAVDCMPYT